MIKLTPGTVAVAFILLTASAVIATIYPTGFDPNSACVSNARQIALGMSMYIQDFDERLPIMDSTAHWEAEILPDIRNPKVFLCPSTGKGYIPNANNQELSLASFSDFFATDTFRDAQAHGDNLKTIAYLDGHIDHGTSVQGDPNALCIDNTRQLAFATLAYAQDNDEFLPATDTQPHFQNAVLPYVGSDPYFFTCPDTLAQYALNPAISGVQQNHIANASTTFSVEDSESHPDGAVSIGFLDGHVTNTDFGNVNIIGNRTECQANLNQLGQAVVAYIFNNNGQLPPTDTTNDFDNALMPYVPNPNILVCPDTGVPYVPNPALNGVNLKTVLDGTTLSIAKDSVLNGDTSSNTLVLNVWDFQVEFVSVQAHYYLVPSQLVSDVSGNISLAWFRTPGAGSVQKSSTSVTDLSNSGTISTTFVYPYPVDPIAVTSVHADQRMILSSTDPNQFNPMNLAGPIDFQLTDKSGAVTCIALDGAFDGWTPLLLTDGGLPQRRLLLRKYTGECSLWYVNADGSYSSNIPLIPSVGETPISMAAGSDGNVRILFSMKSGGSRLWTISNQNVVSSQSPYFSPNGQAIVAVAVRKDNAVHLLVDTGGGTAQVWTLGPTNNVLSTTNITESPGSRASQLAIDRAGDFIVLWKQPGLVAKLTRSTPSGSLLYDQAFNPVM